MSKVEFFKKQIDEMDVKSEEFWEVYSHIADKYFNMENPDHYMNACRAILGFLDRSVNQWEDKVILVSAIVEQVFLMHVNKTKACTGTLGFTDETFFFDVYTSETQKDSLNEQLINAGRAMEKGNFTVKDKFGKKYFNPKEKKK